MEDLLKNQEIKRIIGLKMFKKIIFLDEKEKGKVKNVVNIEN